MLTLTEVSGLSYYVDILVGSGFSPRQYRFFILPPDAKSTSHDYWALAQGRERVLDNTSVVHQSLEGDCILKTDKFSDGVYTQTDYYGRVYSYPCIYFAGYPYPIDHIWSGSGTFSARIEQDWQTQLFDFVSEDVSVTVTPTRYDVSVTTRFRGRGTSQINEMVSTTSADIRWSDFTLRTRGSGWARMPFRNFGSPSGPADFNNWPATLNSLPRVDNRLAMQDLARRCAQDAQYMHSNLYEFFKDIPSFGASEIQALSKLRTQFSMKTLSGAYLSQKYGTRLTVSETPQLWGDLFAPRRNSARAREVIHHPYVRNGVQGSYTESLNLKIYYETDEKGLLDELRLWGILPDIYEIWETVPLSFAVDWFVPIKERLSVIDAKDHFRRFPTLGSVSSTKIEGTVPAAWFSRNAVGSVNIRSYRRHASEHVPQPSYFNSKPTRFNNLVELGALLIQRF